ncbi:MAG: amidohydrolase family protein [Finegoldia sp.]|nr:amidohydrolase family protein [Finegoldia sp.]
MIRVAKECGIAVASHDDDSIEKLNFVEELGIKISEFPLTLEIAREANKRGMYTIAGAPNLMMGKSHSGNLSAREGIMDGSISIISSDYYPCALLVSIFDMAEKGGIDLNKMFNMATINPARATGIDDEVGSIEEGKYADLLVINKNGKYPALKMALIDGHKVFETSYRHDN